jgi:hypothetical protein
VTGVSINVGAPAALGATKHVTKPVPVVDDLMVSEKVPVASDVPDVALSLAPLVPATEHETF